jgi:myosin I
LQFQTQKAVHIVVNTEKDGRVQTMLERAIPLVTIKSILLSTLRDDWMVGIDSLCIRKSLIYY